MLEHSYTISNCDEAYLKSAATCTAKATYYYSCVCGKKGTETFESGEMLEHSYTVLNHDETYHWYKCENCETLSQKEAHYGEWTAVTPSTCKELGTESQYCTVCNTYMETRTATAYAAHTPDENGICTICSKDLYEGLSFTLNASTSTYSVSAQNTSITNICILATYNGVAVTNISWGAFQNCTSLTTVTISNGITSIDGQAFDGCTSLTSVTISDSVTSIGTQAFRGCSSLTNVSLGNGVTSIGSYSFSGCTSLASITIPKSVTSIGYYAFQNCTSLTYIDIPDGVTSVGNWAFKDCTSLKNVTVSDSVKSIGDNAFYSCTVLNSIVIGNGITSIGEWAFGSGLTSIYYNGTADEWSNISINTFNTFLKSTTIYYYSETKPTDTTGNYWHYDANGKIAVWAK